jgi:hypothetical protein
MGIFAPVRRSRQVSMNVKRWNEQASAAVGRQ